MLRSPLGDLVAAAVLAACFIGIAWVAVHDGHLGFIEREKNPAAFWAIVMGASVTGVAVAAMIAAEAIPAL